MTDIRDIKFEVDFGWEKAVHGGPANGGVGSIPGFSSFYISFANKKGIKGIVIPVCLPPRQWKDL